MFLVVVAGNDDGGRNANGGDRGEFNFFDGIIRFFSARKNDGITGKAERFFENECFR